MDEHVITYFDNSPDEGNENCLCSWCGHVISEGIVRTWRDDKEARFHGECFIEVYNLKLIF